MRNHDIRIIIGLINCEFVLKAVTGNTGFRSNQL